MLRTYPAAAKNLSGKSIIYIYRMNYEVGYELRFINEHEIASVTEFFIPGYREHGGF